MKNDYYQKYLKYKNKYLQLKAQLEGGSNETNLIISNYNGYKLYNIEFVDDNKIISGFYIPKVTINNENISVTKDNTEYKFSLTGELLTNSDSKIMLTKHKHKLLQVIEHTPLS
jgi:hypothetical protein